MGRSTKQRTKTGEYTDEDVCPVNPGDKCKAGTEGPEGGQFEFPVEGSFVAVGSNGTVYVGDRNRVQQFSTGRYLSVPDKVAP